MWRVGREEQGSQVCGRITPDQRRTQLQPGPASVNTQVEGEDRSRDREVVVAGPQPHLLPS